MILFKKKKKKIIIIIKIKIKNIKDILIVIEFMK